MEIKKRVILEETLHGIAPPQAQKKQFDTRLFHSLVDYAMVYHDGRMVFTFRDGTEIETKI